MLVVGAMAVIRYAQRHGTRRPWLVQLLARRTIKVAAVALANKTARIWAMNGGGRDLARPRSAGPPPPNEVEKGERSVMRTTGRYRERSNPT